LASGGIEPELRQVMKNIGTILKEQSLSYNDLAFVTIYLKEMKHYETVNKIYQTYFDKDFPSRVCIAVSDLPAQANIEITAIANAQRIEASEVVRLFLNEVRTGLHPEKAKEYMADTVLAHQVNSEGPSTVKRTPQNYTDHVNSFLQLFGRYHFEILEMISQGDKVYVRWKQTGKHMQEIDGYKPTGLELIEYTSAVYRVENSKIVEYWIQMDRLGIDEQLKRNAKKAL
ncbi:MAG TPA: ester cyclase, partial [Flavisolibacter sp.]|nr:ester cyclase [Flavisolibacter sp.]